MAQKRRSVIALTPPVRARGPAPYRQQRTVGSSREAPRAAGAVGAPHGTAQHPPAHAHSSAGACSGSEVAEPLRRAASACCDVLEHAAVRAATCWSVRQLWEPRSRPSTLYGLRTFVCVCALQDVGKGVISRSHIQRERPGPICVLHQYWPRA